MLIKYVCRTNETMHSKTLKIKPQVMESEIIEEKMREKIRNKNLKWTLASKTY